MSFRLTYAAVWIGITFMIISRFPFTIVGAAPTDSDFKQLAEKVDKLSNIVNEQQRDLKDQAAEISALERNVIRQEILHEQMSQKCSKTCKVKRVKGEKGEKGEQGFRGKRGYSGKIGVQGNAGVNGSQGPIGPPGAKGDQGPTGKIGDQGPTGATGPQGQNGAKGDQGPIGATGPQGQKGAKGDLGPTGATGPQGTKGAKGDIGSIGATGPQGQKGTIGVQGPTGGTGRTGSTGPKGQKGVKGNSANMESAVKTTYVRWGRTVCPGTSGTSVLYKGLAGGQSFEHPGGGSNYLCLPHDPEWGHFVGHAGVTGALVYGVEYEFQRGAHHVPFSGANAPGGDPHALHNQDAPCVVCQIPRNTVIMIPAKRSCPFGWTREYKGYLVADKWNHPNNKEYVCVDEAPEAVPGGHENKNGALFYSVEAMCGSLPCPEYVHGRELTCVVCSQ